MKKIINKSKSSISKKIVGLTVFLDALFLVSIITIGILVFSINLQNQKELNLLEENITISESIDYILTTKMSQLNALTEAEATIDYLKLINGGEAPIQNIGDPNYNIYLSSQNLLKQSLSADPMISQAFIVSEVALNGAKITNEGQLFVSDDGFLIQQTQWYDDLIINHHTIITPYMNENDEYQLTIVERVIDQGSLLGYVGIDIDLMLFSDTLLQFVSNESNDLILLSKNNNVIFMSLEYNDSYLGQEVSQYGDIDRQLDLQDGGLNKLLEISDANEVVEEDVFAKTYLIHYNEIEAYNWKVILLEDNKPLLGLEYILLIILFIVGLFIGLLYVVLNKSIRKSLKPVQEIIATIQEIKNGNYKYKAKIKENNEFNDIAHALGDMSDEINRKFNLIQQNINYNDITGLKTKNAIINNINKNILVAEKKVAICLLQIENIKDIVVVKGQEMVNSIMRYMAEIIEHMINQNDILFSNTEFELIFVMNDYDKLSSVENKINKIIDHFSKPIVVEDKKIDVKIFAGLSTYPTDGEDLDELIKKCEIAIYKDKHSTKKQIRFYNDKISQEISYQAEVLNQLSLALERNEIYLNYQPLVDKKSEVYGFESLARWSSEMFGEISPEIFIENAERNYLIVPIGTWILREACKAQVAMAKKFDKEFVMSVNVSLIQIMQSNYVEVVKKIIRETDINPNYLTLELTESIFINSTIALDDKIAELHKIGVKFSLDDFGTGYASLTYLRQIAFDNLKIDKSFIDGVLETSKEHHIVSMVIGLVHHLDMKVIVEGVESLKQFEYLRQISTDVFQGYFISKPLKYNDAVDYVQNFYKIPKAKRIDMLNKLNT